MTWGSTLCHGNPIVKRCLWLIQGKLQKNSQFQHDMQTEANKSDNLFPSGNICMHSDFLLFADASVQISAVSSTLSVTDHKVKHVLFNPNLIFLPPIGFSYAASYLELAPTIKPWYQSWADSVKK